MNMFIKFLIVIFIFTLFTARIYKEEGEYIIQWGLIPLIQYYKQRKHKNNY